MKLRLGDSASRFTPDFDTTRIADVTLEQHVDDMRADLEAGWGGFTGTLGALPAHAPDDVPDDYVMRPYAIRLSYRGQFWIKVLMELGREEVGSGEMAEEPVLASELRDHFMAIGLDEPGPVRLLAAEPQTAQKLHACTYVSPRTGANERAHDLVDIQLLDQDVTIDMAQLGRIGRRLFASRGKQEWPPVVIAHPRWEELYAEAAAGLNVIPDVAGAIVWANELIARAEAAVGGS